VTLWHARPIGVLRGPRSVPDLLVATTVARLAGTGYAMATSSATANRG